MPLEFDKRVPPPTLGKRRTLTEIRAPKKYNVRGGLRSQGGFVSLFNEWDRKKQKEYAAIIARSRNEEVT